MTTRHTPGPWDRGPRCGSVGAAGGITHRIHIIAPSGEPWVADVVAMVPDDTGVGEGNARLIAAAPELLVALRDLCDAIPDETISADPPLGCWVDVARSVIAKVNGIALKKDDSAVPSFRRPSSVSALQQERDALREALTKFGTHRYLCESQTWELSMGTMTGKPCTCGLAALLAEPPK